MSDLTDLTDLEINTEIARIRLLMPKIVGDNVITTRGLFDLFDLEPTHRANKQSTYFLDLMFEFQVSVRFYESLAFIESDYIDMPNKAQYSFEDNCTVSFRRAVLLCIIEAHKES